MLVVSLRGGKLQILVSLRVFWDGKSFSLAKGNKYKVPLLLTIFKCYSDVEDREISCLHPHPPFLVKFKGDY